ncbi:MAG TPA: hypothetical protein VK831_00950, partial [Candidatus Deferrimicrobiaceae bacterium]|nr:hypothetical protein [Candidatus Deferrimicrobiaceae bacterium]
MAARLEHDVGRQPGQRIGEWARQRQPRETERLSRQPVRVSRRRHRDDGSRPRLGRRREQSADAAHRVPQDPHAADVRPCQQPAQPRQRIGAELAGG